MRTHPLLINLPFFCPNHMYLKPNKHIRIRWLLIVGERVIRIEPGHRHRCWCWSCDDVQMSSLEWSYLSYSVSVQVQLRLTPIGCWFISLWNNNKEFFIESVSFSLEERERERWITKINNPKWRKLAKYFLLNSLFIKYK